MSPVQIAIVGCGNRGEAYAECIVRRPEAAVVVAVCDTGRFRRNSLAKLCNVPADQVYQNWEDLVNGPRVADAVIVAVMDDMHLPLVKAFAGAGYHILCEKPMATSVEECVSMVKHVNAANISFGLGHVLRYSLYNVAIKKVIDSGVLGDLVNIQHIEPVGYSHFAHSYVRGNWGKESRATFALMSKCSHDIDILNFYQGDARNPARKVSSFGSLNHFRPQKKPAEAGAATRCLDCAYESKCPYSAKKHYLDPLIYGYDAPEGNRARRFVKEPVLDIENITAALQTSKFGECVYLGQNDVVDHQVVNIEYADGSTASLTMSAFTEAECRRRTVIQGTRGELIGDMETFTVFDFETEKKSRHVPGVLGGGHGDGDDGLTEAFIKAVATQDQAALGMVPEDMLSSHLLVFAAEESRLKGQTIDFTSYSSERR